jgi:hypothetical protein
MERSAQPSIGEMLKKEPIPQPKQALSPVDLKLTVSP